MMYITLSLILTLVVGSTLCAPERMINDHEKVRQEASQDEPEEHIATIAKRSPHYDFGLGKRAYSYVSEYKRLPVYNFGLGKRSSPYSFGLGKRSVNEDSGYDMDLNNDDVDGRLLADLFEDYDQSSKLEKRARPYSFGLGKRFNDDPVEDVKRSRMYDFGLGKRVPVYSFDLGKRGRTYSFGLGKRLSKFNFGLGKRERDLNRFSFGLGKRSMENPAALDNENDVDV